MTSRMLFAILCLTSPAVSAEPIIDFTRDVRPILSNKCFQCHGPDEQTREADLRLDLYEGFLTGGDEAAVVPGSPEQSELFRRVSSADPELRMPPPSSDYKPLTAAEIETLRKWIGEGAVWKQHWAFVTPQRPTPPANVADPADWVRNDIDRFVLDKMVAQGLQPNAEASRETLIRRLTFDLTGLPPTLEDVDAFLADTSPDAYERVVDRLLRSPQYGEHMTRYWLDAARYGDTHGLHLDNVRSIWPYRDWLIKAYNENLPFDQMVIDQLAGDLLDNPTRDQRVATGFNRCNVTTSEGGAIAEEFHVRYTVDRVDTMGTVFLGLTLGCAVCHDHKFDPISQQDFYSLYAFFNSFNEEAMDKNALLPPPFLELPSDGQSTQRETLQTQLKSTADELSATLAAINYVDPWQGDSADQLPTSEFVWIDDEAPSGATLLQAGHPWEFVTAPEAVFHGAKATRRTSEGTAQHYFTGAKPELVIGAGDRLFAYVYLDPENPPRQVMLQFNNGSWEHRAYWGENALHWGQEGTGSGRRLGDLPEAGRWVRLEVPVEQVDLSAGAKLNGWAFTQFGGTVSWDYAGIVTRTPQAGQSFESQRAWELAQGEGKELPKPVQGALKVKPADRKAEQQKLLRDYFLQQVHDPSKKQLAPLLAKQKQLEGDLKQLNDSIAKTLVVEELPKPKEAFVLNRGEYDKRGAAVTRALPAALPPLPAGAPLNRLGLARWLVDRSHPLVSRVTVNRWWLRYFGTGLVKTAEDFGIQGAAPSHPELLDWMAVELMDSGWNVKQMQKQIVMSATYRQHSATTPEKQRRDPANRWLSHGPRFRLEAEAIRDTALAVSGLMNGDIGGPSVKPYQPGGLWEAVGYTDSNTAKFTQDDGAKLYRRSLYTFWKRTSHPPSMAMFDAPSREACTVQRARTNTPLQALALMNDKQYVEAARHFAQRTLAKGGATDGERLTWAFRMVTARRPSDQEQQVLLRLLEQQRNEFNATPQAASDFINSATTRLTSDQQDRDASQDPELAAWTIIANLLLNLDEVVTKG
ncbi:MAG: PSD1 and planctomycete cytochrome C domain-containing protein [Planctomycetaceae bacterium]